MVVSWGDLPFIYFFFFSLFFGLLFLLEALKTDEESRGFFFSNLRHCAYSGERPREGHDGR